jgi:hypothetical protein
LPHESRAGPRHTGDVNVADEIGHARHYNRAMQG